MKRIKTKLTKGKTKTESKLKKQRKHKTQNNSFKRLVHWEDPEGWNGEGGGRGGSGWGTHVNPWLIHVNV